MNFARRHITHAGAKALSEPAVLWKHAFRNAFAPTWTVIGLILGNLLGGIAVIEAVFTIPGLGRCWWTGSMRAIIRSCGAASC